MDSAARYHCCAPKSETDDPPPDLRAKLIPLSEYQEVYNKEFSAKTTPINKRLVSAGVPTKGKPDCQPEDYDVSEGNIPKFKGESTARSSYQPQPAISQLKSFKPQPETKPPVSQLKGCKPQSQTKPPFPLGPEMMESQSYSNWSHSPMPLELARKTAPSIPLWISEKLRPMEYQTRYDLTTSYQADYCGVQSKQRRICYKKLEEQYNYIGGNNISPNPDGPLLKHKPHDKIMDQEETLWNYVHSLLYRTTTGSTYLPPSVFGEPLCHINKQITEDSQVERKFVKSSTIS